MKRLTAACILLACSASVAATGAPVDEGKISLFTVSPELLFGLWRVDAFYGDPNMRRGAIAERSFLLGSLNGMRDDLANKGLIINTDITQFLNSNFKGGARHGTWRYDGSSDYYVGWDSGKAGVWSGGAILLHGESSWRARQSINPDVGSLLPANFDATMPVLNHSTTTLSEAYFVQALPHNFIVLAGKVNFAGLADQNLFANNENRQFIYTGLVNNPILGAFVPYTPLGAGIVWVSESKQHTLAAIALDSDGRANRSGFNTVFNGDTTYGGQYQYTTKINGQLGNYRLIAGYNTKEPLSFAIDPRHLLAEIIGLVEPERKNNNYGVMVNFDQYLWTTSGETTVDKMGKTIHIDKRQGLPPLGVGIFARAGWTPQDRNVIDQYYSFGIGGYGLPFANRPLDNWGIGYGYTHISTDLRRLLRPLHLKTQEHGAEVFYNYAIIPSVHLTINGQAIRSPLRTRKTAYAGGGRLRVKL